jgi:hypothetical protein
LAGKNQARNPRQKVGSANGVWLSRASANDFSLLLLHGQPLKSNKKVAAVNTERASQ